MIFLELCYSQSMSRVSLRRASVQEQRAKRQAIVFMLLSVLIGVIFLMLVMPLIFRVLLGRVERTPLQNDRSDALPPQRPVMASLDAYVKTQILEVKGYTEAGAMVQLYVDGQQSNTVVANEDGSFVFSLDLTEGEHQITAEAADEAGNVSATAPVQFVTVDVTAPTIAIDHPANGVTFSLPRERALTVTGKLSEAGVVYVNQAMVQTNDEGVFSVPFQLGEGENTLTVRGQDKAGNETESQELKVHYRP